jgi:hypothetical protein
VVKLLELLLAGGILGAPLPPVRASGVATVYWRGDGQSGRFLGCVREARRLLGRNEFRDDLPIIATRDNPPCGTFVVVEHARTGRRTGAVKLDFGPFGCRLPDGQRQVVLGEHCHAQGGRRLAIADLTRRVASEIGHQGREAIRLRWW